MADYQDRDQPCLHCGTVARIKVISPRATNRSRPDKVLSVHDDDGTPAEHQCTRNVAPSIDDADTADETRRRGDSGDGPSFGFATGSRRQVARAGPTDQRHPPSQADLLVLRQRRYLASG
jgi:hypothetical protein